MKKNLFARIMRASGRLLLFCGTVLAFGLTIIHIYMYVYHLQNPDVDFEISDLTSVTTTVNNNDGTNVMTYVLTGLAIVVAIGLLIVVAKIYNKHIRSVIARLARLFHAKIFTVEIVSTVIVWSIAALLIAIAFPAMSAIFAIALVINELLFVFAWGAYGQPNYKI